MRRTIAALIAGIILGSTGVVGAAATYGYWAESGTDYKCEGYGGGVNCKERHGYFGVTITKSYVAVTRRGKGIYGCEKGYGSAYSACFGD